MAKKEKITKFTEKKIRDSLEEQLRDRGADVAHFQSLIEDYLFFWRMSKSAQESILHDGAMIDSVSASGKEYRKENPAIKQAAMYNQRMLATLREMGLTTDKVRPKTEGADDL
jgi:hypothetical protein